MTWSTRSQHRLIWTTQGYQILWNKGEFRTLWYVDTLEGYFEGSAAFLNWEWATNDA